MGDKSVATAIDVNHDVLKDLIKSYYYHKRALFTWGPPGIGKSDSLRQAAAEIAKDLGKELKDPEFEYSEYIRDINNIHRFMVIDIRLSQSDPSDLRGIPIFNQDKQATVWLPPEQFPRTGYGIIFFDELNLSPPLVQASAYQLILDRRLGFYTVPDGYSMVAAGNRLEDRANVFEMSAPLKNRFGHVQLNIPSVDDWTKWAIEHEVDVRVIGFLNFRRAALFAWDSKLKENAFPTPRTWKFTSDLIKDIDSSDLAWLQTVAATQIGLGYAGELGTFIRIKDKLKPIEYYLKDPDKAELPDESSQTDLVWALITSLAEYYKAHQTTKDLESIIKLIRRMNEEYSVFTLKLMISFDKMLTSKIIKMPVAAKLARKLIDFFE